MSTATRRRPSRLRVVARLRRAAAVVLLCVALLAASGSAGGQLGDLLWTTTAYGSAHCTVDRNNVVCARFGSDPNAPVYVFRAWLPGWCQFAGYASGDAAGTPLRVWLQSNERAQSCIATPWGWADGGWQIDGTNYVDARWVSESTVQVFGRDGAWAVGTVLEIR